MIKPDERAQKCKEMYEGLIAALRYTARRCGYAIAVHGSVQRDIDLIACPWRDTAISGDRLIENLVEVCRAVCGTARLREDDRNPEKKDCGRAAWSIYLSAHDDGPYLDISVMPRNGTYP